MSERNPGTGGHRRDDDWQPARSGWSEEPGSSVFDRRYADPARDRGRQPYPGPAAYPGPGGYPGSTDAPHPTVPYDRAPYPADPRSPAPRRDGPADPRGEPGRRRPTGRPGAGPQGRQGRPDARGPDARRPSSPNDGEGRGFPLGAGALVGTVGLACFLVGLIVLPWFSAGGQDVTLADIRTAFTVAETRPDEAQPDAADDVLPPEGGLPTPDDVADAAEQQVRDAAEDAATAAIDSGRARYLELYTERLWMGVAAAAAAAVVFSTILAPQSFALSMLLGFRRAAGAVTVLAAIAHGGALWVVFTGEGAPSPAWGVWLGAAGLGGVLLGCIVGPKR